MSTSLLLTDPKLNKIAADYGLSFDDAIRLDQLLGADRTGGNYQSYLLKLYASLGATARDQLIRDLPRIRALLLAVEKLRSEFIVPVQEMANGLHIRRPRSLDAVSDDVHLCARELLDNRRPLPPEVRRYVEQFGNQVVTRREADWSDILDFAEIAARGDGQSKAETANRLSELIAHLPKGFLPRVFQIQEALMQNADEEVMRACEHLSREVEKLARSPQKVRAQQPSRRGYMPRIFT